MSACCLVATAALGPSAAQAPLGRHDSGATPPFHLDVGPPAWLVTLLPALAVVAGAAAVALVLVGRWRPSPIRLAGAGFAVAAVLALLPPVGSADPLSYASYGRMVVTGHDPYTTQPAALAARDPVAAAVETPWQHEPSVYGPLATGEQAVAAAIGGRDPARIVLVLDLLGAIAFVAVGLMLLRRATDDSGRRRAAALWCANPLLWLQVVAGAHLDVLVAAVAVSAVLTARRQPVVGAALAGVAGIIKPTGGLVWVAIAWGERRNPRRLLLLAAVAAVVVVPAYAAVGSAAVRQLGRAGRRVSHATPWRTVLDVMHAPRGVIGVAALLLAVVLAVLLARGYRTTTVPVVAVAVTIAYVLAAPYALPWYDALPWALLPLLATSGRDWLLLAHTTVLSLAYLPGRDAVRLHGALHAVTSGMRSVVAPVLLLILILATVRLSRSVDGVEIGGGRGI